eukprot:4143896-Pleurochrysis_carterae.AAC.2
MGHRVAPPTQSRLRAHSAYVVRVPARAGVGSFASKSERLSSSAYVVAASIDGADKRDARIRLACALPAHLLRLAAVTVREETFLVPSDGSVRSRRVEALGAIVLSQVALPTPPDVARKMMLEEICARGVYRTLFSPEGSASAQLLARLAFLRALQPDAGWPDCSEQALAAQSD